GEPSTAQCRTSPSEPGSAVTAAGVRLAPGLEFLPDLLEVRLVIRELRLAGVEVHSDKIEPLPLIRIRRRFECCSARGGDWPGRQSLVAVGVVLRLALAVLLGG